jgi:hypothetical protein
MGGRGGVSLHLGPAKEQARLCHLNLKDEEHERRKGDPKNE